MLATPSFLLSQSQLKKEIEKMIHYDTEIEYKKTPGFIVHIIDGESSYTEHFGNSPKNTLDTLCIEDKFQLGSVSKIFTALLINELAKVEVLSLDDPISMYLDPTVSNPNMQALSIRDLLLHATNFPKRPNNFGKKEKDIADPYAYYTKDDLLAFYLSYDKKHKTDKKERASYSHINYALLEVIAEQASKTSFEDLLQTYVFQNAGMFDTGIVIPLDSLHIGYRKTRKESTPWTFASFAGSEGIYSNAKDLGQFIKNYFNNDAFILAASMDTISNSFIPTKYNDKFLSAMGWQVIQGQTPYNICAMAGTTDGHNAFIAMVKETKTAVIVLANSAVGTEDLGMQILRMINNNWKRKAEHEQE